MSQVLFRLFVAGDTPRSQQAIENLRRLCDEMADDSPECVVIDVLDKPELAEAERILTTPTLIKVTPPPSRRVTGDLSDREAVLRGLTLKIERP